MDNNRVLFHEIDFLLLTHKFNISFSYISQRGLPFIREFVLRLIHLAPMQPGNIAEYLGMSAREIDEAVGDLLSKGEIEYQDDGSVKLTALANGYFKALGDSPQVSTVQQTDTTFAFELAGFNCVGSKNTRENWRAGVPLPIDSERRGLSDKYAHKEFQRQFYRLLDDGHMKHIRSPENDLPPSIYKMDAVRRIGEQPIRISHAFHMDEHGRQLDHDELDSFRNDEPIIEAISRAVNKTSNGSNLYGIAEVMEALGDNVTGEFITSSGIDISSLIIDIAKREHGDAAIQPFLGPIYSKENWARFSQLFDQVNEKQRTTHQESVPELLWLAPSDRFWGKSQRFLSAKDGLIASSNSKGKQSKAIYKPKLYLPLRDSRDKAGVAEWKRQIGNIDHCYGYAEGLGNGDVEALILPAHYAIVCYHLSIPSVSPVSIPLGFVTTEISMVDKVSQFIGDYLNSNFAFDKPVYLGKLSEL